jgi:hypothetical protein
MIDQVDFHDGYVDGLLTFNSVVQILLRSVAGEKFTLTLRGVEAFRADDLRQGNIILELRLLTVDQIDALFIFDLYGYSNESRQGFSLNAWVERAKGEGLLALDIQPSYGCSISAIFKDCALERGAPTL